MTILSVSVSIANMLKIRLQRVGRKHEPTFRLVLTDSQNSTKSGRYLEVLGNHDPRNKDKTHVDVEKVKYWISMGAKPTDTVHNMLISKKIISGKKVNVLPKKSPIKKAEEAKKADQPAQPEAPALVAEVAPEATPVA